MFEGNDLNEATDYIKKLTKFYKSGKKELIFLIDCTYDSIDYLDYLKMLFSNVFFWLCQC